ncbi:F-box/LRR-repeat protein 2-like [Aphidius gifuensis]|uniref:F-box/LRR-repeat protein 2-like n=1 Tax=Aphidius gifuensis TaxID=684658 RepID=UPI001CDD50AD|nr:F-box/LRR-repeat protein 2-like [Aphidius gifuensis]
MTVCVNITEAAHVYNQLGKTRRNRYQSYGWCYRQFYRNSKTSILVCKGCLLDDMIQEISETTTLVELSLIDCFVSENCVYNPVDIFNQFENLEYININNEWGIKTPNVLNNILNSSKNIIHCNILLHPYWYAPNILITNWDNLKNLEHLGTRWRIDDNTAMKLVKYCKNLMSVDLWSEGMIGTALQKLTELKNLEYLYYCFVDGVRNESINTIVTISNWKKLKHLILFNDEGCDVIDDNIIGPAPSVVNFDELSKLQYLESLSLFNMYNFPDSSIIAIANSCKNLRKLEMTACVNITEAALMPIISLEKLEEINVNYMNGLTDNFISKLKGLKKFGCACCKNITDAGIIEFIKNCPNLHTLCVFGCNITIKTFIGADEITKHRTNNIALGISYEDFAEASTLKIESNWLFICPKVRENVK